MSVTDLKDNQFYENHVLFIPHLRRITLKSKAFYFSILSNSTEVVFTSTDNHKPFLPLKPVLCLNLYRVLLQALYSV